MRGPHAADPEPNRRTEDDAQDIDPAWMLFGDLVSRLSNWPYGADYGLLFGLTWDTKWAC